KISAARPSSFSTSAMGLALSEPVTARRPIETRGTSAPINTPGFSHASGVLLGRRRAGITTCDVAISASEVRMQVHARVQIGHRVGIPVEWQRLAASELADATFGRLAPTRMIHRRIHVGVEAVLVRTGELPGISRLGGG